MTTSEDINHPPKGISKHRQRQLQLVKTLKKLH